MKKIGRWLLLSFLIALSLACLVFLFINVNRGIVIPQGTPVPDTEAVDVHGQDAAIAQHLKDAPWQGLRFLTKEQEWRFYGWTGELRQVKYSVPFDLIKVYYLEADGGLAYTWVATGADIPGEGYHNAALSPVHPGQLVAVRLFGKHVGQWGVDWNDCNSEYCHLAAMIDSMLILDDQGTGLSNGFIKYGWEPPTYPLYGFLVWSIEPASEAPALASTAK